MDNSTTLRPHPAWALEARPSPLESSSGYSTALSSPTTPHPPLSNPQSQVPLLPPTLPLNITRRQARLAQIEAHGGAGMHGGSARDREPMPPPQGPPPPRPTITTSNSGVPPQRPPRPPIGLGISSPSHIGLLSPSSPPSASASTFASNSSSTPVSTSTSTSRSSRPSSRRALTRALELAQEAVELDKDAEAQKAVDAYGRSVELLGEVMARVARGESSSASGAGGGGGKRRSMVARDEEMRRLKAIHDTYADRMRILCILHSVTPSPSLPPHIAALRLASPPLPTSQPSSDTEHSDAEAIGNTLVSLSQSSSGADLQDQASSPDTPLRRVHAQQPHITQASSHNYTHSRTISHSSTPAPSLAPSQSSSQRTNLPPPRPPPAVGLPPLPLEATTKSSHSPTTPTPPSGSNASPPRKLATRQARSSSLSLRTTGPPPPPVPPLPPLPAPFSPSPLLTGNSFVSPNPNLYPSNSNSPNPDSDRADQKTPVPPFTSTSQTSTPSLVSSSTAQGTISQRRRGAAPGTSPTLPQFPQSQGQAAVPTIKLPSTTATPTLARPQTHQGTQGGPGPGVSQSLRIPGTATNPAAAQQTRMRAVSQPGARPSTGPADIPSLPRRSEPLVAPSPALQPALSPLPLPADLALRPFVLMRALLLSILRPPGFHLTPRLFIPTALWSQGGAKLLSLPQKTSSLLTLSHALEELSRHSEERERERKGGWAIEGREEEGWERALGEWEKVCAEVRESTRGKGGFGGVGGKEGKGMGGMGSFGLGRLGKQIEKMTNGKNLDSPGAYVQALTKFFQAVPVLETHLKALLTPSPQSSTSPSTTYAHLSPAQRAALEQRLRRSAEFFARWVIPFVVRDLGLLMEKYLKKGEKWLEE